MDQKFIQSIPSIRKKICRGSMQIHDVEPMHEQLLTYAVTLINQDRQGRGIDKDLRDTLEDFLMICLDVYTYSDDGAVMIPDYTYDQCMAIFCKLFNAERISQSDYIVSTTIWPFVKHEAPFMVGTINRKIYDLDGLAYFLKESRRDGYRRILYAPKFDGVSSAVTFRNGQIERAVTRNNGIEGQDITQVIRRMNRVKHIFNKDLPDGYYKCELVVTSKDFEDLCKLKQYANRRSATSAIVSAPSNLVYAEYLTAIPLAWVNFIGSHMKYLAWQYADGLVDDPESFDLETVYENIERILAHIRSADYPIRVDGVVLFPVRTNDDEPNTTDLMANCMAYKVNTQENRTKVDYIYMSVGRMGMAKPMVHVEPVEVNETIVRDVSLGSMSQFTARNLHEHEEVIVYSAGDVIPQIKMPEPRVYSKDAKRLKMDISCPYCGKKLRPKYESEADLYCLNPRCPRVLSGRIANFLDKLDVAEGFRDSTFYTLVEAGMVKSIEDLFDLDKYPDRVAELLNSRVDADKLLNGLKELKTKQFEVSQVIGALGIDNIAQKTCQTIFSDITLDYLLSMKKGRVEMALLGIPGIGMTTAQQFSEWINENRDFLEFLLHEMKIVDDKITYGAVCFTGFRNKEYSDIFKSIGFPALDRVTKDTVACVYAGDLTSNNAKKALAKDIPLVHVAQIDELIKELTKRAKEIELDNGEISRYELMRDVRKNVPVHRE